MARKVILTFRQYQVLRKTGQGLLLKQIAGALDITERTVSFHAQRAVEKLGCVTLAQAAVELATLDAKRKIRMLRRILREKNKHEMRQLSVGLSVRTATPIQQQQRQSRKLLWDMWA